MLELHDLVKHYRGGGEVIRAVDGVSLTVPPGEFVALYGPSGSGKTTLLQLVASLLKPDDGRVYFAGRDITQLTTREAAAYRLADVGIIFQSFHLIDGASAIDNASVKLLATGLSLREAREPAHEWLKRLGLGRRADHRPGELSAGERQRVAIARALVGEPRLLLADEPTGSLDSRRSAEVFNLLRDVCEEREMAGIVVTHDPQAAHHVSRVLSLQDGRLREGVEGDLAPTAP